jgi:uncharacterized Zn finger protein (UPF0148 family)
LSDKPQEYDGHCHSLTRAGKPCGRTPAAGAVVCPSHGGNLPKVKNAARIRVARDEATKEALRRLKADKNKSHDTITEMDRLAAEAIVWKDVCRERVDKLVELGEDVRYKGQTGEQLRAEVALYERALATCNTILSNNIKLNIHEKKVELEKAKAMIVAQAIRTILNRLELTPEQARLAPMVIKEEMLAISAEVS